MPVLAQAIAAGVRPQLARSAEAGNAAVRRAVLSVAQQQRLAACTALLTEVALHYGFALHVAPDVGDEDAGVHYLCITNACICTCQCFTPLITPP